jgi:hypothetical protein
MENLWYSKPLQGLQKLPQLVLLIPYLLMKTQHKDQRQDSGLHIILQKKDVSIGDLTAKFSGLRFWLGSKFISKWKGEIWRPWTLFCELGGKKKKSRISVFTVHFVSLKDLIFLTGTSELKKGKKEFTIFWKDEATFAESSGEESLWSLERWAEWVLFSLRRTYWALILWVPEEGVWMTPVQTAALC